MDPESVERLSQVEVIRKEMRTLEDKMIEVDRDIKKTESSWLEKRIFTVHGEVELTTHERKFLSLKPYFPRMESLD